ncbi:thioredoxin-disulfide reductase [Buchnera aphidicola]|uniref:Thioredoxin reductase n=1 Tax=Buchnera aphidicola subsp. Tuberolachnus salignus TaxID=98804 RepID=A0A160SYT5_BUCTT|nr:thioredoxin-disulfide reductase [Buchnera aphidicola]CUR53181.1 Thioredoxin reductase [Buchnera aphidicola (Tuberolachnus salignus)]
MYIKKNIYVPLIIIGSGPAGYTAGIYAARSNIKTIIFTGPYPGGQLLNTSSIENWPGDFKNISGYDLMERMKKHVQILNVQIFNETVIKILCKKKNFLIFTNNTQYICDAIIIATGATARFLNIPFEKEYLGKGISTCAICDGYFYKEQIVAVVGGGNTAIEEALYLSNITEKVILIHRKKTFSAEKILIERLLKKVFEKKILIYQPYYIQEIIGNKKNITHIKIKSLENQDNKILNISGLFIAIGYIPNSHIFKKFLQLNSTGHIILNHQQKIFTTQTSYPGIFAAGDVTDNQYQQAITASANGCKAAMDVEKYLHI